MTLPSGGWIAQIHIYPVKGLRGCEIATCRVEPWGLEGDRRWMLVDAAGTFLSQRELPGMARIGVETGSEGIFLVADGDRVAARFPNPASPRRNVLVWRDTVSVLVAEDDANRWLSLKLGVACSLVYMDEPVSARAIDPAFAAGAPVSFADGFPILITSLVSLRELNTRSGVRTPMDRFRANIVIDGAEPWAEDRWHTITAGSTVLAPVKPCARCSVTTVEQATGLRLGREPLRTLATFRRASDGGVRFGQNIVPVRTGSLSVGDPVGIVEQSTAIDGLNPSALLDVSAPQQTQREPAAWR